MEFLELLLSKMNDLDKARNKFLIALFTTILVLRGKMNFRNMSRYSDYHEKTFSRNFRKHFDFSKFNSILIDVAMEADHVCIAGIDCSFIPKSGDKTYGKEIFWDSSSNRPKKGLEVSNLSVIDVETKESYTVSALQTPPLSEIREDLFDPDMNIDKNTVSDFKPEEYDSFLETFPHAEKILKPLAKTVQKKVKIKVHNITDSQRKALGHDAFDVILKHTITRVDFYVSQLTREVMNLPEHVDYIVGDGYYAKLKFVNGAMDVGLHIISKLRCDADLRYLYTGKQKSSGANRKYDGKVDINDLSRFDYAGKQDKHIHLYTAVVYNINLKRNVRIVVLVNKKDPKNLKYVILFSTDIHLSAKKIYKYYKARFQIEFIFRDAKQFTGLCDCQATCQEALHFHFNASFTALNIAKLDAKTRFQKKASQPFSMASLKAVYFNEHLLSRFISMSGLDPTSKKLNDAFQELSTYGVIDHFLA
jgi:hypothetical protein